ncbi:hypothetical protein HDV00_010402 [Rhizophlyctis rosea]|nr:hypothetical protein HDV00_010402 [Rhizophlyctis rosea]
MANPRDALKAVADALESAAAKRDQHWNVNSLSAQLTPEFLEYYAKERWDSELDPVQGRVAKAGILLALAMKKRIPRDLKAVVKQIFDKAFASGDEYLYSLCSLIETKYHDDKGYLNLNLKDDSVPMITAREVVIPILNNKELSFGPKELAYLHPAIASAYGASERLGSSDAPLRFRKEAPLPSWEERLNKLHSSASTGGSASGGSPTTTSPSIALPRNGPAAIKTNGPPPRKLSQASPINTFGGLFGGGQRRTSTAINNATRRTSTLLVKATPGKYMEQKSKVGRMDEMESIRAKQEEVEHKRQQQEEKERAKQAKQQEREDKKREREEAAAQRKAEHDLQKTERDRTRAEETDRKIRNILEMQTRDWDAEDQDGGGPSSPLRKRKSSAITEDDEDFFPNKSSNRKRAPARRASSNDYASPQTPFSPISADSPTASSPAIRHSPTPMDVDMKSKSSSPLPTPPATETSQPPAAHQMQIPAFQVPSPPTIPQPPSVDEVLEGAAVSADQRELVHKFLLGQLPQEEGRREEIELSNKNVLVGGRWKVESLWLLLDLGTSTWRKVRRKKPLPMDPKHDPVAS